MASKTSKVSKRSVHYKKAPIYTSRNCGSCSMFSMPNSCSLVAGIIRTNDVCDKWSPKR